MSEKRYESGWFEESLRNSLDKPPPPRAGIPEDRRVVGRTADGRLVYEDEHFGRNANDLHSRN